MKNNTPELLPCPFCGSPARKLKCIRKGLIKHKVNKIKGKSCVLDGLVCTHDEWNTRAKDSERKI